MKHLTIILCLILIWLGTTICQAQSGTMTDPRDGKIYKTIQIGSQVWMAENLAYATSITYLFLKLNKVETDIYCFDDDTVNCQKYGMLYTWKAAQDACPEGWHLPGKEEFDSLLSTVGGDKKSAYYALIKGGRSGFEGFFGGKLLISHGSYLRFYGRGSLGKSGYYWSSTKKSKKVAIYFVTGSVHKRAVLASADKLSAFSIRCVKDNSK